MRYAGQDIKQMNLSLLHFTCCACPLACTKEDDNLWNRVHQQRNQHGPDLAALVQARGHAQHVTLHSLSSSNACLKLAMLVRLIYLDVARPKRCCASFGLVEGRSCLQAIPSQCLC